MLVIFSGSAAIALTACASEDTGVPVDETGTCPPTPGQEEGTSYVDQDVLRSDIVDGQTGVALDLWIKVLRARTCEPVSNAAVDVWAANAVGKYSDNKKDGTIGQKYLRGIQMTDTTGFVKFKMIYPGWYDGRAPHVHIKVRTNGAPTETHYTGGNVVHTGQIFFPADINESVRGVYTGNGNAFANNDKDPIYKRQGGPRSGVALEGTIESGYAGTIAIDVTT